MGRSQGRIFPPLPSPLLLAVCWREAYACVCCVRGACVSTCSMLACSMVRTSTKMVTVSSSLTPVFNHFHSHFNTLLILHPFTHKRTIAPTPALTPNYTQTHPHLHLHSFTHTSTQTCTFAHSPSNKPAPALTEGHPPLHTHEHPHPACTFTEAHTLTTNHGAS